MTVCIAAACGNGERIVTATDGRLSLTDVAGDCVAAKMTWYGDWQFMYAGDPARFSLVSDEIEVAGLDDSSALSRRSVQRTVHNAYRKIRARLSSCEALDPFNMTIEEFKRDGRKSFSEPFHDETLRLISQRSAQIQDQILVTGWGQTPHSAMVYEVGPFGDSLHTASGFACIGSGAQMAQTMLLLLGQGRHRTLAETIFNVACAKFSAEKSAGLDVGPTTAMYVSRKRTETDDINRLCGVFLSEDEIASLRGLWDEHLKPRIPDEARSVMSAIGARVNNGEIAFRDVAEHVNAASRLREKYAANQAGGRYLPRPTADQSRPQPLPESPEESGES